MAIPSAVLSYRHPILLAAAAAGPPPAPVISNYQIAAAGIDISGYQYLYYGTTVPQATFSILG